MPKITGVLIITNKRVNGKTGLINTNELDSPLNKINGVQVRQGLFGKIYIILWYLFVYYTNLTINLPKMHKRIRTICKSVCTSLQIHL